MLNFYLKVTTINGYENINLAIHDMAFNIIKIDNLSKPQALSKIQYIPEL